MKTLPIDQVEANSTLGTHLTNSANIIILRRGTKLSAGMLNRLRRMGMETLCVDSHESTELFAERKLLIDAVEERFAGSEASPFLQELKRIAIGHLTL